MAALSSSSSSFIPISYTPEELNAMREVKSLLLSKGVDESRIGHCTLAVAVINTKLRVEEAATKYMTSTVANTHAMMFTNGISRRRAFRRTPPRRAKAIGVVSVETSIV